MGEQEVIKEELEAKWDVLMWFWWTDELICVHVGNGWSAHSII